jgi:hypothetical protein
MSGEPVSGEHTDVGAYALGVLEPEDRRAVEEHLAGCPACAAELAELSGMKELLTGLGPVSAAADEPTGAEVADLVRRRAADQRRRARWRTALGAAAAVVLLAGGVGVGVAVASQPTPAAPPTVTSAATSRVTGVHGMVSLLAKTWGAVATLQLSHLHGPLDCQIVAVSRTGERQVMGSWLVPKGAKFGVTGHPKPLVIQGPVAIKINDLLRIEVNLVHGRTLVSIPVTGAPAT